MKAMTSSESGLDAYHVFRHLFNAAKNEAPGWELYSSYTDVGKTVMTSYQFQTTGDIIKCQSFDYDVNTGLYKKHIFTFTQGVDREDISHAEANPEVQGPNGPLQQLVGQPNV